MRYGAPVVFSTSDRVFLGLPMASKPPDAFLSYTRFDDQHEGGAISEFRKRLATPCAPSPARVFNIFSGGRCIGIGRLRPRARPGMIAKAISHGNSAGDAHP